MIDVIDPAALTLPPTIQVSINIAAPLAANETTSPGAA